MIARTSLGVLIPRCGAAAAAAVVRWCEVVGMRVADDVDGRAFTKVPPPPFGDERI